MGKPLIPAQRRERIQEYLAVHQIARTIDLMNLLETSEATVRRDLEWLPGKGGKEANSESDDPGRRYEPEAISLPLAESPGLELKLIGYTVDEASDVLDQYLDRAYRAGLPWVRIVHGKGSGILRKSIRDALHDHPLVKSFQRAGDSEGGDGVTVAMLVT